MLVSVLMTLPWKIILRADITALHQSSPYEKIPLIGTSIGGSDNAEIGTLGLYLDATRKDGSKIVYALSCAHVLAPHSSNDNSKSILYPYVLFLLVSMCCCRWANSLDPKILILAPMRYNTPFLK